MTKHSTVLDGNVLSGESLCLKILGHAPIPRERVDEYKREQIEANPPSVLWRYAERMGGARNIEKLILALLAFSCAAFMAGLSLIGTNSDSGALTHIIGSAAVFFGMIAFGLFILTGARRTLRGPCYWEEVPLPYWELPAYAKKIVDGIWDFSPKAKFSVDLLKRDDIVLDPILYLHTKDGAVALCIWDEDGVEIRL